MNHQEVKGKTQALKDELATMFRMFERDTGYAVESLNATKTAEKTWQIGMITISKKK